MKFADSIFLLISRNTQFLRHPTGTTITPSWRLYANCPTPVSTIMKEGDFILPVSILADSESRFLAPSSII